jgi:AcrR family transcriptional regulator
MFTTIERERSMPSRPKLTQQRRLQTLDAAVEVIGERGLCETRVADVAAKAGLSPALLLYYFGSKDNLLTEALTYAEDAFYLKTFHELSAIDDPRLRLIRLTQLSMPPQRGKLTGDWTLWIELWTRALRDENVAKKREALDRRWRNTISDIVRAGQKTGHFDPAQDPDVFALRMAALMDGLVIQVLLHDPDVDSERATEVCIEMASRELAFEIPLDELQPVSSTRRRSARIRT